MTRVACIDIGTVTARLAVADVEGGRVTRMLKQSTICNLGEGLTRTGLIAEAAAVRVLACVDSYLAAARQARAPRICCTLTSAARDAANSDALLAELAARGLHAQVIPGEVEGSLTFLGVAQDFADREILVADNGGGSTEIAVGSMGAERGLALDRVRSVDVGCRRMTEKFLSAGDPPSADDVERARQWARGMFDDAVAAEGVRELAPEPMVTTGGTVTTGATESERAAMAGLQPKRANVILGGTIAVASLMESCGFDRLTVSESDLLFGLSICAAAAADGGASPLGWEPDLSELR